MSLTHGARLGAYEVVGFLRAGGVGEVSRATDTRLLHDVALKIPPDAFASDPDPLTRFKRKAHVVVSLNYPNIAQIHGPEESEGGKAALILDLVERTPLADRIAQGSIPLDETRSSKLERDVALKSCHSLNGSCRRRKLGLSGGEFWSS